MREKYLNENSEWKKEAKKKERKTWRKKKRNLYKNMHMKYYKEINTSEREVPEWK